MPIDVPGKMYNTAAFPTPIASRGWASTSSRIHSRNPELRTKGSNREVTWLNIRHAAINLLYRKGFRKMNVRELSGVAGLQAGSLYNYFDSKDDLLYRLITEITDDLLAEVSQRLDAVEDPVERVKRYIETMVKWHTLRRKEAYIGHMEVRSLSTKRYKIHIRQRDQAEQIFTKILADGCAAGIFEVPDAKIATMSTLAMLRGIADWYRQRGRFSSSQLVEIYTELILKQITAPALPSLPKRNLKKASEASEA